MMCFHLELGQLWRCPVELCAIWKGSVKDYREHFNDKHGGSATLDFGSVSRSFPPWTVPRELWQMALRLEVSCIAVDVRLFHEAGCRLVHKYRVYKDPLPHPALRGGVIPKLLSFVGRAMAISQLTQLRISIASSGAPPGEVPADCFPSTDYLAVTMAPRRVTFAPDIPTLMEETQLQLTDTDRSPADRCVTATDAESRPITPPETSERTISLPLGFPQFQWPQADWILKGDPSIDPGLKFVTSWFTRIIKERAAELPPLPLSPITAEGSQDSIMVQVGSPVDETPTPVGLCQTRSTHRRRPRRPLKHEFQQEKPAPAEDFLFKNILRAPDMGVPRQPTETDGNQDQKRIPRWRLAREGPFLNERSSASLRVLGTGCAFRQTTYRAEDHAPPPGGLGVPLNHPRFLEWVGAPASAWLMEMSPGQWSDTLSRDQAMPKTRVL